MGYVIMFTHRPGRSSAGSAVSPPRPYPPVSIYLSIHLFLYIYVGYINILTRRLGRSSAGSAVTSPRLSTPPRYRSSCQIYIYLSIYIYRST